MRDPPRPDEDTTCPECGCDTTIELPNDGQGICDCDCHWERTRDDR